MKVISDGISGGCADYMNSGFGIKVVPVSSHSLTEWERGGLILGYTEINEKQIKNGVRQLVKVIEK